MKIDPSRNKRQHEAVAAWLVKKKGTIIGPTGFGKSRCGHIAMSKGLPHYRGMDSLDYAGMVVVPTDALRKQWTNALSSLGLLEGVLVDTYAGVYVRKESISVGILVLDEVHRAPAESFRQVFSLIKYRSAMGLTATLEREDNMHIIVENYLPVVDKITEAECLANGWISPYMEINIGIDMSDEQAEKYNSIDWAFKKYFGPVFNYDFNMMQNCLIGEGIRGKIYGMKGSEYREQVARGLGWKPGMDNHKYSPQNIHRIAISCNNAIRQRKEFLYTLPEKLDVLQRIVEMNPEGRFVHFCMDINTAVTAHEMMGGSIYHSQIPTEARLDGKVVARSKKMVKGGKTKTVYSLTPAFRDRLPSGKAHGFLKEEIKEIFPGCTFVGPKRLKDEAIALFQSGQNKIMHCVKALDEGLDVPGIDCAIVTSGSGAARQGKQRKGRAIRFVEGKTAYIFNVYVRGTQDEKWLQKRQEYTLSAVEASIDDIYYDDGYVVSTRVSL